MMRRVKQCDHCKKVFRVNEKRTIEFKGQEIRVNTMTIDFKNEFDKQVGAFANVNLCQDCLNEFAQWIK